MNSFFVDYSQPPRRLPLPGLGDGAWVDVKPQLSYGAEQDMYASMRRQFAQGESPILDPTRIGQARMEGYIVGWSFVDPSGKPVPVTPSAMRDLLPHVAHAIRDALDAHEEHALQERSAEKNAPDGTSASSPILPSVS